jgi:hypothetical protein
MGMAGHQNLSCKKLKKHSAEYKLIASNSKQGQGPYRAVRSMVVVVVVVVVLVIHLMKCWNLLH